MRELAPRGQCRPGRENTQPFPPICGKNVTPTYLAEEMQHYNPKAKISSTSASESAHIHIPVSVAVPAVMMASVTSLASAAAGQVCRPGRVRLSEAAPVASAAARCARGRRGGRG